MTDLMSITPRVVHDHVNGTLLLDGNRIEYAATIHSLPADDVLAICAYFGRTSKAALIDLFELRQLTAIEIGHNRLLNELASARTSAQRKEINKRLRAYEREHSMFEETING